MRKITGISLISLLLSGCTAFTVYPDPQNFKNPIEYLKAYEDADRGYNLGLEYLDMSQRTKSVRGALYYETDWCSPNDYVAKHLKAEMEKYCHTQYGGEIVTLDKSSGWNIARDIYVDPEHYWCVSKSGDKAYFRVQNAYSRSYKCVAGHKVSFDLLTRDVNKPQSEWENEAQYNGFYNKKLLEERESEKIAAQRFDADSIKPDLRTKFKSIDSSNVARVSFTFDGYTLGESNLKKLDRRCYPDANINGQSFGLNSLIHRYGFDVKETPPSSCSFKKELPNIHDVWLGYRKDHLISIYISFDESGVGRPTIEKWIEEKLGKDAKRYRRTENGIGNEIIIYDYPNFVVEVGSSISIRDKSLSQKSIQWSDARGGRQFCIDKFCLSRFATSKEALNTAKSEGFTRVGMGFWVKDNYKIFGLNAQKVQLFSFNNNYQLDQVQIINPRDLWEDDLKYLFLASKWEIEGSVKNMSKVLHFDRTGYPMGISDPQTKLVTYSYKPSFVDQNYPSLVAIVEIQPDGRVVSVKLFNPLIGE